MGEGDRGLRNYVVTGAQGFLGSRIREALGARATPSLRGLGVDQLRRLLDGLQPEGIIHTAAISDTARCERDEAASYEANVALPLRLARAAGGIPLVMLSSDQVYNGCEEEGPFDEQAPLAPRNVYGRHKLEMERRVLDAAPGAVMLRATWLFDMPAHGAANRGNFLMNLLLAALRRQPIGFSGRQYRGLSYAREAAERIAQALSLPGGVYNFGSETSLSMLDAARETLRLLGADAQVSDAPPLPSLWMDCARARAAGIDFKHTMAAIAACLKDYALLAPGAGG